MQNARIHLFTLALLLAFAGVPAPASAQTTVGGITPSQRPAQAPRITEVRHDQGWYRRALTGVSKPYPASLLFLDRQGDWYTPFTRPGMPGPYDLRGWFKSPR